MEQVLHHEHARAEGVLRRAAPRRVARGATLRGVTLRGVPSLQPAQPAQAAAALPVHAPAHPRELHRGNQVVRAARAAERGGRGERRNHLLLRLEQQVELRRRPRRAAQRHQRRDRRRECSRRLRAPRVRCSRPLLRRWQLVAFSLGEHAAAARGDDARGGGRQWRAAVAAGAEQVRGEGEVGHRVEQP